MLRVIFHASESWQPGHDCYARYLAVAPKSGKPPRNTHGLDPLILVVTVPLGGRWRLRARSSGGNSTPGHPDLREGRIPAGRDGVNQQLIQYRLSLLSDNHLATNLEKAVRLPVKFVIRSRSHLTPCMVSQWYRGIDHRGTRRAATGCPPVLLVTSKLVGEIVREAAPSADL